LAYLWKHVGLSWELLSLACACSFLLLIATIDLKYRLIPDVLIYPAALVTLLLRTILPGGNPLTALLGGVVGFSIFLLAALVVWLIFRRSPEGYRMRATGLSPQAARYGGISTNAITVRAMAVSGALAGLVGVHEVLLTRHRFLDNFSSGLGFLGIAVALMGKNHPLGVVLAALLFGFLNTGALEIDIFTEVPRELVMVLQALVILFVVTMGELASRRARRRRREDGA